LKAVSSRAELEPASDVVGSWPAQLAAQVEGVEQAAVPLPRGKEPIPSREGMPQELWKRLKAQRGMAVALLE